MAPSNLSLFLACQQDKSKANQDGLLWHRDVNFPQAFPVTVEMTDGTGESPKTKQPMLSSKPDSKSTQKARATKQQTHPSLPAEPLVSDGLNTSLLFCFG